MHGLLQKVTEEMWQKRAVRFPTHMPTTKEYYLLRSIFEDHFPSEAALRTVPTVRNQPVQHQPQEACSKIWPAIREGCSCVYASVGLMYRLW